MGSGTLIRMTLDNKNLKILKILQQEGRISNQKLADKVALSPSACLARVRMMEKQGYIEGFRTKIKLDKLGSVLMAFMEVTLNSHSPQDFSKFDSFLQEIDEVIETFVVGSHFDYLLQIAVSDMSELRELSNQILESGLGVTKLNTIPIIEIPKPFHGYPLSTIVRDFDT